MPQVPLVGPLTGRKQVKAVRAGHSLITTDGERGLTNMLTAAGLPIRFVIEVIHIASISRKA